MPESSPTRVQPLSGLRFRFDANVRALDATRPELAARLRALEPTEEYLFACAEDRIVLVRRVGDHAEVLPNPESPAVARQTIQSLFPRLACTEPVLVAGLDQGWLWSALHSLPCADPRHPGHRPPLYLLARELERLWVVLHVQEWTVLLGDPRVRLFVGEDTLDQCRTELQDNPLLRWPRLSVTADPQLWPPGTTHDSWLASVCNEMVARSKRQIASYDQHYACATPGALAEKIRSGRRLRVLGLTSLYTSFLQHSMRDWLAAFEKLGHETRLLIESADHEQANGLTYSQLCSDFKPDVILLLNHCRAETPTLPAGAVCLTWVQDEMPNILSPDAGRRQGPRDFMVGHGRELCVSRHGYPAERFVATPVGVNDQRFAPRPLNEQERSRFGCDVSYVSHASTRADVLLKQWTEEIPHSHLRRLLGDVYERLHAIYDAGGSITEPSLLRHVVLDAMEATGVEVDEPTLDQLVGRLFQGINNALFRHQSLLWLADSDINLHLYGRGWEAHPQLKRFARGIADNQAHLCAIYQASRINLQVIPHGAVHQRLCDGLAAGGFFLLRYCASDVVGGIRQRLWQWCRRQGIETDVQLIEHADDEVRGLLDQLGWQLPSADSPPDRLRIGALARAAAANFAPLRGTLWPAGVDLIDKIHRPLWQWCQENSVTTDRDLLERMPQHLRRRIGLATPALAPNAEKRRHVVNYLRDWDVDGADRYAACVWPEEYEKVVFHSHEELAGRVRHYLEHEDERREIAHSMRRIALDRFTYRAITRRVLDVVADQLKHSASAAAA